MFHTGGERQDHADALVRARTSASRSTARRARRWRGCWPTGLWSTRTSCNDQQTPEPRRKPARAGAADQADGFRADIAAEKPIWLHPSVSDTLREWSHLYRRLGLILEQLAAHGRTAIVKGCARPNRGWRRSPLGGARGSHYYLWWGIAGSSGPADSCDAEPGTIVVRAVRHHDDHAALGGGRRADYLPIQQATDIGEEARSGESVLYVTWSARLQRSAEERLAALAPSTSRVRATDFRTLTGEITGADVRRIPPAESRRKLGLAIEQAIGHERHPWKGHEAAVYAEVRGRRRPPHRHLSIPPAVDAPRVVTNAGRATSR